MAKRNRWVHARATPHRPAAHGKLEVKVRWTKEATRCNLRQARLPHKWWTFAARHAAFARDVWRKGTDGQTAYERKHGVSSFTGKMVPFGMGIQFRATKPNRDKLLEFDARAVDGIFLGWDLQPGMSFKGDYVVAAWSDFQALGLDAKVPVHVVREIVVLESVTFPIADAERAMGLRLPLPAGEQQQQQQQLPAEHSAQDTDVSELVDQPQPRRGRQSQLTQRVSSTMISDRTPAACVQSSRRGSRHKSGLPSAKRGGKSSSTKPWLRRLPPTRRKSRWRRPT